jgi:hypothetical protein
MRGAAVKINRRKLATTFQIPLLALGRCMNFFSSRALGVAVVCLQKPGPKKKNPTASKVSGGGILKLPGL